MRKLGLFGVFAIAMSAWTMTVPVSTQSSLPTRLLQQADLTHQGSFTLPDVSDNASNPQEGFAYSHGVIGFNPANNSLFVVGHDWNQRVAEINIPSMGGVATMRQQFADAFEGKMGQINSGDPNGEKVGGLYVSGDKLIMTAYSYYDANATASRSHFVRPVNLSTRGQVVGPFKVGSQPVAFMAGYFAPIPSVWRAALGGDLLNGMCCISILERTSAGPSVSAVNASALLGGGSPSSTTLTAYPEGHRTIGDYVEGVRFSLTNAYGIETRVKGVVFPEGSASVLFIGSQGIGTTCYGTGSQCNDPVLQDQGGHAYPYQAEVWAYNANDLAAAKAGTKQPWDVKPYAVWKLPGLDGWQVGGATIDPATNRIFVAENYGDGMKMRIHVFSVAGGSSAPPSDTTSPTVGLTSPAASASVAGMTTLSATATDNVGVRGVWFTVDGATVGAEDTTAPYSTSWNSTSVGNGSHVIRAMARDAAGNTAGSSTATVTVNNNTGDTVAPTVSITAPTLNSILSGSITLGANASDNVGVASVQFTVDGANVGAADTTAPYSTSWNTAGVANGLHTVRAVARDAAGNTATATAISVTVTNLLPDLAGPTVNVTSPAAGGTVSGTVTLGANASDNVGVVGVQFTVDGVNVGAEDTSAPFSASWVTTSATNAGHTVRAVARDAAGNKTTSAGVSVTVSNTTAPPPGGGDSVKPVVSITSPSAWETESGYVVIEANATDNVGIRDVTIYRDGRVIARISGEGPYRTTWYTSYYDNGSHQVWAVARDAAGNQTTSARVTFTVRNGTRRR